MDGVDGSCCLQEMASLLLCATKGICHYPAPLIIPCKCERSQVFHIRLQFIFFFYYVCALANFDNAY